MSYFMSICSMIFGAGVFGFIQFLINRKDEKIIKKEEKEELYNQFKDLLLKLEKDGVRNNLLIMMNMYPNRKEEIMQVAEHYFKDLNGNWFVTPIFKDWLKDNKIDEPDWVK